MKNIIKIPAPAVFAFIAMLFCAAAASAQSNDYKACRCRQWNGSNLSSLGVTLNDCCSLKQSGYNVGSYFSGTGTTVGSQSGANVTCGLTCTLPQVLVGGVCKTPCGTCSGVRVRDFSVLYSEDGLCCILPPPAGLCPAGAESNCCGVGVWNSQTCTCDCSGWYNHDRMGTTYIWNTSYEMCCPYNVVGECIKCI